ncbi:MAG: sensor histidine kinase [Opitutaceae bacterium]|nr:sensor histidine kinase [Opitutaceae bacterium]
MHGEARAVRLRAFARGMAVGLALFAGVVASFAAGNIQGLPFSRTYSLEDIGYVPRGSRLNFDAFGRIAVIHDGVFAVLNDTAWLNIVDAEQAARTPMTDVVHAGYGRSYYGGRGTWGLAEFGLDGKLRAKPLVPNDPPSWTRATTFEDVIVTTDGVCFGGRNGFAFWDFSRKECELFEIRNARLFAAGNRIFVSTFASGLQGFDLKERRLRAIDAPGFERLFVERATLLDEQRALLALVDGRLMVFDGQILAPWAGQAKNDLRGRISAVRQLADGNIAVAINGRGVFVVTADGHLRASLATPQYHHVARVASREPGVLWVLTEDSVEKVLYGGGLTSFGQRLGLPLGWPLIARWHDRLFVASDGVLYEATSPGLGAPARFERVKSQPAPGVWSLTAHGPNLLVGNPNGIFSLEADGSFKRIGGVRRLHNLTLVTETLCYATGPQEIALFEWDGQEWSEPVPRIPGLPNLFTVHRAPKSVWIEMGGDGVARVFHRDGRLHLMVRPNEPDEKERWVNVSVVGNLAMLSTHRGKRRFFDEETDMWCERPPLARLLDRSPRWLARAWRDEKGTLWATHQEGVVRFTPTNGDGDYEMDLSTFDLINDRYPLVQILPGNDVWISASRSLHHVEQVPSAPTRANAEPVLVSLVDTRRNVELLAKRFQDAPLRLSFAQNSLTFRFFSGGYAWRRAPVYEYRLNPRDPWATLDTGSLLRFANLREGKYHLQVRSAGEYPGAEKPLAFQFEILPPWHRTWPAYALYASICVLAIFGTTRLSGRLARQRNRVLEQLVHERTGELESAMKKFNEETRIRATLAERDRLAGEIHDSVQQGLSGAMLQLDTTLKQPSVGRELRSRLDVVRNMVSHARQEVQHAVWDMDSPLLEDNDLGEALRKLATFTSASDQVPAVEVAGTPVLLPRFTTHHLLRIAQEATTNAMRHATARRIAIRLEYTASVVALTITDDGAGFRADDALSRPGHFGLRGMRGRAKKLGGDLTITSAPQAGTTIRVHVPLPAPSISDAANHHPS